MPRSHSDDHRQPAAPAPRGLQILPVHGIPEVRPGDDLPALLLSAARADLQDGDVLVVTSKVVSKAEGRLLPSPTDPARRDAFRRDVIDRETVRLVAQIGRTKIVENHLGIVAAAAGVDASNVQRNEIALLPIDPDASAAAIAERCAEAGLRIGVIITDTQGRAWREGVTDIAIGAAGAPVLDDHRGGVDKFGNDLVVTQVAIGDEIAAAADLVKGKLADVPVAIVRGLDAPGHEAPGAGPPDQSGGRPPQRGAAALIRPSQTDLFRLGTELAIDRGRLDALAEAPPGHQVLRADARTILQSWRPPNAAQAALREAFLGFIAARPDATARSCVPGHITASTIVLSSDRRHVLLTLHPRVGRWIQLGGHCESEDDTIAGAARREAVEESGIDVTIDPEPLALDVHPITCSLGVATRHFDIRYVAVAPPHALATRSAESLDLRFWPIDRLPADIESDGLGEVIRSAARR